MLWVPLQRTKQGSHSPVVSNNTSQARQPSVTSSITSQAGHANVTYYLLNWLLWCICALAGQVLQHLSPGKPYES